MQPREASLITFFFSLATHCVASQHSVCTALMHRVAEPPSPSLNEAGGGDTDTNDLLTLMIFTDTNDLLTLMT
jgi:hypothetical protein